MSTEAPQQTSELQNAMEVFQESIPRIKHLVATMDRNTLARVFLASVSYPFVDKLVLTKNRQEQELFIVTVGTLAAKNIITSSVSKKEIETETVDGIVDELIPSKEETYERTETMDQSGQSEHQSAGQEG